MKKVKIKYLYIYQVDEIWYIQSILIDRLQLVSTKDSYLMFSRKRRLQAWFNHVNC